MKKTVKGQMNMWKPLGIAGIVLLAVVGCSKDNPAENIGGGSPTATGQAQDATEAPKALADDDSDIQNLKSNIDPEKVEIPTEIEKIYEENSETLVAEAQDFAVALDAQGTLQDPGADLKKFETQWKAGVGANMTPDVADELWKDITSENGSSLVAMWVGDNTATVDGKTYTLTGDPWSFLYGDPEISQLDDEKGIVQYAHVVRYHIPVVDESGAEKWLTTDVTRTYNLTPGYTEQPWVVTGMWASEPSAYKIADKEAKE